MSKHSIAKELVADGLALAKTENIDSFEVMEALITAAIQSLAELKGGAYTKPYVQYECDSISADGLFEIQRR